MGTVYGSSPPPVRRRWWQHSAAWVGGVATAVVTGVLIALVPQWIGPTRVDNAETPPITASPGSAVPSTTGPTATVSPDGPAPLTVAAKKILDACGQHFMVEGTYTRTDDIPTNTAGALASWITRYQAVPVASQIQFTVQGESPAQVTLTGLSIRTLDRRPASHGTDLTFNRGCGGSSTFRWFAVDLDENPPVITSRYEAQIAERDNVPLANRTPVAFPYVVSLTDSETFVAIAQTRLCDCDWQIELNWASQGHTGVFVVNDNGKPFHTMGAGQATSRCDYSTPAQFGCTAVA